MPLTIIQPANDVANVIRGQLQSMATDGRFRTAQLRAAAPAALSLAAPHPAYNLGLDAIRGDNPLSKATLTTWRYLVLDGEQSIATAEALPASVTSQKPVFSHTNEGPLVTSFGKAVVIAEKLPELADKTYELAVLRIPALHVTALWMQGRSPNFADDLFIPLDPAPPGLKPEEKTTAKSFMKALAKLKTERGPSEGSSN